ncbi:MAG: hypothetical protein NTV89_04575, partial [Proteobacteria bacterium]|nr:hypothetical protein [Pseudomonadota bacterium]
DEQYIGAKVIALQEIEEAFEVIKGNREKIKVYIENNKNTLPDDFSNILKDINYVASLDIDADQRLNVFMKTLGYDCNKLWNYFVMSLVYLGAVALLAIGIVVIGDAIIMLIPDPSILGPIAIGVLQLTMLAGMVIELGLAVVAAFLIIINNTAFLALPLCWMGLI